MAVCHRPELLLLDEPLTAMDPLVRDAVLDFLLELLREGGTTILISSHILRDIERVVDRIVCLEEGRLKAAGALDDLQERYAEWVVSPESRGRREAVEPLPARFPEPYVHRQRRVEDQAVLEVWDAAGHLHSFEEEHQVKVSARPLRLERILTSLLETRP